MCAPPLTKNEKFIALGKKRKMEETKTNEESLDKIKKNGKELMKMIYLMIYYLTKMEK